jgi:hypothetical protein
MMLTAWRVESLVNYLQVVAVEVADVVRVIAAPEVGPCSGLAFALSARFDGGSIDGVDTPGDQPLSNIDLTSFTPLIRSLGLPSVSADLAR